jgi:hypothetical protein
MNLQADGAEMLSYQTWGKQIVKVWRYIEMMDKQKMSMPKVSTAMYPLVSLLRD